MNSIRTYCEERIEQNYKKVCYSPPCPEFYIATYADRLYNKKLNTVKFTWRYTDNR